MERMNGIKYPTGTNQWTQVKNRDGHSGRGQSLESDINDSNSWYRETGKALIYKKPTPVQVVHVDYPARNRARITEAYYRTPSTTDYNGVYKGKYVDFEAKETQCKTGFPLYLVHPHQIAHLKRVREHGGCGFFIIRFTSRQVTMVVDAPSLIRAMDQCEKSLVPYAWFEEHGIPVGEGLCPRLAYLKAVDQLLAEHE